MSPRARVWSRVALLSVLLGVSGYLWWQRYQAVAAENRAAAEDDVAAAEERAATGGIHFYLDADGYVYYTPGPEEIARDLEMLERRKMAKAQGDGR